MILNKNYFFIYFSILFSCLIFSQETTKDSLTVERLEQVIITGQYNLQSVNKSVFEVKVINRKEIENRAVNNLADLLNQSLNINITPNTSTGKSGVSLFGLDAQYFKILIDNIPVINEEGVGNNVDLTLINLDDVQQIEIIEGAMGVQYGANAISGVINIITKKSSKYKTQINAFVQEETVGTEYEWFDKGRHIQSLKVGHNFTNEIYGTVSYLRNDFAGFWDNKQGKVYDIDDGLRGHVWLPKAQQNIKILLNHKKGKHNVFYKFDYLNERINRYDTIVDLNHNSSTDTNDPLGSDRLFKNNRFIHHLNATGYLGVQVRYNVSASYQEQTKDLETYTYRIRKDEKTNIEESEYLSRRAFLSRGTFSNLIYTNKFNLQAGYELTNESGFGSPLAITVSPDDENTVKQRLDSYDVFASSEITISDKLSLRPGVRVSFTNLFENQYAFSLSSKFNLKNNWQLKGVVGSANRTPNYNELYSRLVDINHNVQGNPNLNPEQGFSAFVHLKKKYTLANDKIKAKSRISGSYINVKNRIELIIVNISPREDKYNNIDTYKSFGVFSENAFQYNQFRFQLGASLLGISKVLNSETNSEDDFLLNFQLNSNINYTIPNWNTTFALNFKHVGKEQQFVQKTNEEGNQEFQRGVTDAFSWFDLTLRKTFLDKRIETSIGIRNLLDVTSVNTTAFSGGAHNGPPTNLLLGYGRSYFLKLTYNLNL
ncbi:TonB-dependent receptor plug domain-containing protein [Flavivirga jejuensis]|uniref:TonB-dependent receptor n=1 Tax=Flavivirga jejuensis TaxID=870487 RepID=A0ABT8WI32_9FLAO|nr:TonB-dependent receptor [Flavivirga jejuensis]MDO5972713.1 TonB-dependent receptor [Flavivirga jejuensis]